MTTTHSRRNERVFPGRDVYTWSCDPTKPERTATHVVTDTISERQQQQNSNHSVVFARYFRSGRFEIIGHQHRIRLIDNRTIEFITNVYVWDLRILHWRLTWGSHLKDKRMKLNLKLHLLRPSYPGLVSTYQTKSSTAPWAPFGLLNLHHILWGPAKNSPDYPNFPVYLSAHHLHKWLRVRI